MSAQTLRLRKDLLSNNQKKSEAALSTAIDLACSGKLSRTVISQWGSDTNVKVRFAYAMIVSELSSHASPMMLLNGLSDSSSEVRRLCVEPLLNDLGPNSSTAISRVVRLLDDKAHRVREIAVRVLAYTRESYLRKAVSKRRRELATNNTTGKLVCQALEQSMTCDPELETLRQLAVYPYRSVRLAAMVSSVRIGIDASEITLLSLNDSNASIRRCTLAVVQPFDRLAQSLINIIKRDPSTAVRAAAFDAVARLHMINDAIRRAALQALTNTSHAIRREAITLLQNDRICLSQHIEAFVRAINDPDSVVQYWGAMGLTKHAEEQRNISLRPQWMRIIWAAACDERKDENVRAKLAYVIAKCEVRVSDIAALCMEENIGKLLGHRADDIRYWAKRINDNMQSASDLNAN